MAHFILNANALFSGSAWAQVSAAGLLDSEAGSTALTTVAQDSSGFVLEANQIDGFAVKLASRAAGTPTNTITFILRNSTTATNIWSVTLNVSDLDPASNSGSYGADSLEAEGGWYFINGGSNHTPNGTDTYVIRVLMNSTSTAVSLWTDGSAANWSRIVRRTSTATPVAGDVLHVMGEWTAAATVATRTLTMDNNTTTAYGNGATGSTGLATPGFTIDNHGVVTFSTSAATKLRLSGTLVIYSSGILNMGTVGTPAPRAQDMILEFNCGADGDFGLSVRNGGAFNAYGQSRTAGKNIVWTLLTADNVATNTTSTVADDTGWKNGDEVALAGTGTAANESESKTLNLDATATVLSYSSGLTNAHKGTAATLTQAEVVLLNRDVKVRAVSASFGIIFRLRQTCVVNSQWTEFRYLSGSSVSWRLTTGSINIVYSSFRDCRGQIIQLSNSMSSGGTLTFQHNVVYLAAVGGAGITVQQTNTSTGGTVVLDDCVFIDNQSGAGALNFINWRDRGLTSFTMTNLRCSSGKATGILLNPAAIVDWTVFTVGGFTVHSMNGASANGITLSGGSINLHVTGSLVAWRCGNFGVLIQSDSHLNMEIDDVLSYGNATAGIQLQNTIDVTFHKLRCFGDTAQAQPKGLSFAQASSKIARVVVNQGDFGTATGVWVTHSTADISFDATTQCLFLVTLNYTKLSSGTDILNFNYATGNVSYGSFLRRQRIGQATATHKTMTIVGNLTYETGTVQGSTAALQLTPLSASFKLRSDYGQMRQGFLVPIKSGVSPNISLFVRVNPAYNGNPPRLRVARDPGMGINADTTLATHSGTADVWEQLTGNVAAVPDDGVLQVYVDCDGTAGSAFVDTGEVA